MVKYVVHNDMAILFDSNIYFDLKYFESCFEIAFLKVCIRFFPLMPNLNMLQNFLQVHKSSKFVCGPLYSVSPTNIRSFAILSHCYLKQKERNAWMEMCDKKVYYFCFFQNRHQN